MGNKPKRYIPARYKRNKEMIKKVIELNGEQLLIDLANVSDWNVIPRNSSVFISVTREAVFEAAARGKIEYEIKDEGYWAIIK